MNYALAYEAVLRYAAAEHRAYLDRILDAADRRMRTPPMTKESDAEDRERASATDAFATALEDAADPRALLVRQQADRDAGAFASATDHMAHVLGLRPEEVAAAPVGHLDPERPILLPDETELGVHVHRDRPSGRHLVALHWRARHPEHPLGNATFTGYFPPEEAASVAAGIAPGEADRIRTGIETSLGHRSGYPHAF